MDKITRLNFATGNNFPSLKDTKKNASEINHVKNIPLKAFKSNVGLNPENTWLVLGCSTYIKTVSNIIPDLLKNYRSIGLNSFPLHYAGCEFIATMDRNSLFKNYRGSKFIIGWGKNNKNYYKYHKTADIAYIFRSVITEPVLRDTFQWIDRDNLKFKAGRLLCRHTIAHPAINYALLQGVENVVLIGVDFSFNWQHFYDKTKPVSAMSTRYRRVRQRRMNNLLCKLNRHINVYNVNPSTETTVPVINIEELGV